MKVCDKTCIFCFFPIINKYLCMAKRSLLSRCPSYILWKPIPVASHSKTLFFVRSLYCECCVLSGKGLCVGLVTRPEESYRMSWCAWVWLWNLDNKDRVGPLGSVVSWGGKKYTSEWKMVISSSITHSWPSSNLFLWCVTCVTESAPLNTSELIDS